MGEEDKMRRPLIIFAFSSRSSSTSVMESECQDMRAEMWADAWEAWEEEGEEWYSEKGIAQMGQWDVDRHPERNPTSIYSLGVVLTKP